MVPRARPWISLTVLAVGDVDRAARFYETVFGWRRQVDLVPVYVEFAHEPGTAGLSLYARGRFEEMAGCRATLPPPGGQTSSEIYVTVSDAAALDSAIAALDVLGAPRLSPRARRPWGDEAAYFADPDGNVVAVACALDDAD